MVPPIPERMEGYLNSLKLCEYRSWLCCCWAEFIIESHVVLRPCLDVYVLRPKRSWLVLPLREWLAFLHGSHGCGLGRHLRATTARKFRGRVQLPMKSASLEHERKEVQRKGSSFL